MSPALGVAGQGRHLFYNAPPPRPDFFEKRILIRRAKRKRGLGKMNFCPPALPAEGGIGRKRWAGLSPCGRQLKVIKILFKKGSSSVQQIRPDETFRFFEAI